jgi:purine-binding chemotaxis protein CheW
MIIVKERGDMTETLSRLIISDDEDTMLGKYLTFQLGTEIFGIAIKFVTEIIGIQSITFVPEVPKFVKGIINLRGKIIPVIDMRLKFNKPSVDYDDRTCIIVIDFNETSIGLIVDCVSEVLNIGDDKIVPPPSYKAGVQNKYIKGIGKVGDTIKLLIDCEKIISEN